LYAYVSDERLDAEISSLCYGSRPGMQMVYIADREKLIVASERTNLEEEWKPLPSGQLLTGCIKDGEVVIAQTTI